MIVRFCLLIWCLLTVVIVYGNMFAISQYVEILDVYPSDGLFVVYVLAPIFETFAAALAITFLGSVAILLLLLPLLLWEGFGKLQKDIGL